MKFTLFTKPQTAKSMNFKENALAFTLIEMLVVVVILAVLATISIIAYGNLYKNTFDVICQANLRTLHGAAYSYIDDKGSWPQTPDNLKGGQHRLMEWYIDELTPYGAELKYWQCPAHMDRLDKDTIERGEIEIYSYRATHFDARPTTPWKWNKQPWFIELLPFHKNGVSYYVVPDGSVKRFNEAISIQ